MKKHPCLLPLIALIAATGCIQPAKPGEQIWIYSKNPDRTGAWDSTMSSMNFVDLRPDGRYTQDFGHFSYGSWQLKNKQLYLTDQHRKTYVYRIAYMNKTLLALQLGRGDEIGAFKAGGRPPGAETL